MPSAPEGVIYGIARIDSSGGICERAIIAALGWAGGDRLTFTADAGVVTARRDPGGMVTLPASTYITIPAALRRRCGLEAGDQVLLAALPDQGSLRDGNSDRDVEHHRVPVGYNRGAHRTWGSTGSPRWWSSERAVAQWRQQPSFRGKTSGSCRASAALTTWSTWRAGTSSGASARRRSRRCWARSSTFVDADALEAMTGHPVRSGYKDPGEPEVLPSADALIVAPATTNTINKWAAGISDTLPLGLLVEEIAKGLPIVAMPFTNRAQAAHPVFEPNIELLRSWGVTVLYGPDVYLLHEPGEGWQTITRFPWHLTLDALDRLTSQRS